MAENNFPTPGERYYFADKKTGRIKQRAVSIDARRHKDDNLRGARFDMSGNVVSGKTINDAVTGGKFDENGKYMGYGDKVKAGTTLDTPGLSTLERHKRGLTTPNLGAFGPKSAQVQTPAPVTPAVAAPAKPVEVTTVAEAPPPKEQTAAAAPVASGSATPEAPEKTGKQISQESRAQFTDNPREKWNELRLSEKRAAHAADPSLPVPGKNERMEQHLTHRRAEVVREGAGATLRQAQARANAFGTSADPAVQAEDKKTLAERGTIAVDPRYAGNGQLTNQKVMGEYVTKGGGSTSPTAAPKWPPTKTAGVTIPTAADMTPKTAFAGASATPAVAYRPQAPGMPAVTAPDTRMPAVAAAPMQPLATPDRPGMVKGFNSNRPANDWDNQVALKREATRQAQNTPEALAARKASEAGARKVVDDLSYFPRKALEASGNVAQAVGNAASAVGGAAADVVQTVTDPAKQRAFAEGMGVKTQDAPRATAFGTTPAAAPTAMNEKKRKNSFGT